MKDNVLFAQWLLALKHSRRSPRYYSPIASGANRSTAFVQRLKWLFVQLLLGFLLSSVLLVAGLRFLSPPTTAFMLHTHIDDLVAAKTYRAIDQRWVDATHISKYASLAVVASEDQLFYQHFGFDMDAIYRAYDRYQRGGKLRGASTISQQVAKNLFLSPARNFGRKVFEVWFTLLIEILWSKQRILEMYLNIAEFGDHLYGIEAASQHFFKLPAKQLSAPQAALLAATLPNPRLLRADRPSAFLGRRQQWILGQMRHLSPAS